MASNLHKFFNALTAGVALLFGFESTIPAAIKTLLIVMALDLVMSFLAAYLANATSVKAFLTELWRKVGIGIIVMLAYVLTSLVVGNDTGDAIGQATAGFYIAVESLAILKKTDAIGIPIPDFLRAALDKLSSGNQMRRITDRQQKE